MRAEKVGSLIVNLPKFYGKKGNNNKNEVYQTADKPKKALGVRIIRQLLCNFASI